MTKLAPEVRLDPKRSLAALFWPIRPIRPAQGRPKQPFLGFSKNGFLAKFSLSQTAQICLLWVFGRFLAPKCPVFQILGLCAGIGEIWNLPVLTPHRANAFLRRGSPKIPLPRRRTRWVYHMIHRVPNATLQAGRKLSSKLAVLKITRFTL